MVQFVEAAKRAIATKVYTFISFQILKRCHTKYETKIQAARLIKILNLTLNMQLYAKGASFLCSIF